ncbi:unnamed protein product [Pylaiella littoralis]
MDSDVQDPSRHELKEAGHGTLRRLATPLIAASVSFRCEHVEGFFQSTKRELVSFGASQFCQNELRAQVDVSSAYYAELIARGYVSDTGGSRPLGEDIVEDMRSVRLKLNIINDTPTARYIERHQRGADVFACLFGANH